MPNNLFDPLQAVSLDLQTLGVGKSRKLFANVIQFYNSGDDPAILQSVQIVLLGVLNKPGSLALNGIRDSFYRLYYHGESLSIVDVGDVVDSPEDTVLEQLLAYFRHRNIFVIMFGDSLSHSKATYLGLEKEMEAITISCIAPSVSLHRNGVPNHLSQLVDFKDHNLFDLNILAHQLYLSDPDSLDQFSANYFQTIRLGILRNDILTAEPLLRDSDILLLDMAAIRCGDAPLSSLATPNGLYSEEACQLARYAGISDKLKIAAILGFDLRQELNGQNAQLIAQLIWHFVDGYAHRKNEVLLNCVNTIKKIIVNLDTPSRRLHFYRSDISERWWMEVSGVDDVNTLIIACSVDDYHTACNHEVPMRWVWFHQKLLSRTSKI